MLTGQVCGKQVYEPVFDKWQCLIGCGGAMWPSHRLPHGTLWLALQCLEKLCYGAHGIRNPNLQQGYGLAGPGLPPGLLVLLTIYMENYLFKLKQSASRRHKGLGLSPSPWLYYAPIRPAHQWIEPARGLFTRP
jgi:hypothetical protein